MQLKITDLLDEYMYDDIPLDPVGQKGTKETKGTRMPNHRRFGQMVAAAVIVLCVFVTGSLYFMGTGDGKSLSDDSGTVPEERASFEDTEITELEPTFYPEPTPSIQPEPTPVLTDAPDVEYSVEPTPVPTPTPENTVAVWDDGGEFEEEQCYSQVISMNPFGDGVTVTQTDGEAIWGFGDFSFDEENGYVSFVLTYVGFDREAIVVGSEEQMKLGQAAESDAQFFVIDGVNLDGTAFSLPNPTLVESDAKNGRYQYQMQWLQATPYETIKEFYLRKGITP